MEITGKIIAVLPVVTGQGKNGEWKKQEFILEIPDATYPKKLCLSLWGDKIPAPQIGQQVKVNFDVESREYNTRWYTECKAWKIESESVASAPTTIQQPAQQPAAQDDLPF